MQVWEHFNVATDIGIEDLDELPPIFQGALTAESLEDIGAWLTDETLLAVWGNSGFRLVARDDPPPPIPAAVTQLQFRRSLRHFALYDAVVAFVATQNAETQEAFDYASMVRRDSPSLNTGADALLEEAGQATLDAVFTYAANVVE